jgi:hypothetical protein
MVSPATVVVHSVLNPLDGIVSTLVPSGVINPSPAGVVIAICAKLQKGNDNIINNFLILLKLTRYYTLHWVPCLQSGIITFLILVIGIR